MAASQERQPAEGLVTECLVKHLERKKKCRSALGGTTSELSDSKAFRVAVDNVFGRCKTRLKTVLVKLTSLLNYHCLSYTYSILCCKEN